MQSESTGKPNRRAGVDEQIERCVQFALRGSSPSRALDERRRHKRHPFPYPVRVFPVNALNEVTDDPILVIGKHLTSQGFDFYFQHPVSHRRVSSGPAFTTRSSIAAGGTSAPAPLATWRATS